MGIPVRILDSPIAEASRSLGRAEGNCILTMGDGPWTPTGENLDSASWVMAREWVARGNTLVIVTANSGALPAEARKELIRRTIHETAASGSVFGLLSAVDNRVETARASVVSGGALTVAANGQRWTVSTSPASRAGAAAASGSKSTGKLEAEDWMLAADGRGGVLFRIPIRRGAVYVLLDDFAWTNAGLDQGDNAQVLSDILGRELRGGVLAIDEYRHGHGRAESFLVYLSNLPGLSAILWLGLIWAILYCYGRNVRLKPVEPFVEHERRRRKSTSTRLRSFTSGASCAAGGFCGGAAASAAFAHAGGMPGGGRVAVANRRGLREERGAAGQSDGGNRPGERTDSASEENIWNSRGFMNTRAG